MNRIHLTYFARLCIIRLSDFQLHREHVMRKKEIVLLAALFLTGIVVGTTFVYLFWRTGIPAAPFVGASADLTYNGVYIDLIEQAEVDDRQREWQSNSDSDSSDPYVVKYNSDTGYADGITVTCAGITDRQVSFVYEGIQLELHFVNDVLIGCRRTYEQELMDRLEGRSLESCTAEEREAAEQGALEILLDHDSWETDEDYLKFVLADYVRQVQEYQDSHPNAVASSKQSGSDASGV